MTEMQEFIFHSQFFVLCIILFEKKKSIIKLNIFVGQFLLSSWSVYGQRTAYCRFLIQTDEAKELVINLITIIKCHLQ